MKQARQSKTFEKNVEKLIDVMKINSTYKDVMAYIIARSFPNEKKVADKVMEILLTHSNMDKMGVIVKKAYMDHYTPAEIVAMLKFYCSKHGKGILEKSSILSITLANSMRDLTDKMLEDSKEQINALLRNRLKLIEM